MAYNTAITFPPKSHTHSEYAPTNHTHTGYAATSHTHSNITSKGKLAPQTGRTQSLGNVYTYELWNQTSPVSYGSVLGFGAFGNGGGQVELASSWAGTPTVYVRALRDVTDNWTNWTQLLSNNGGTVIGQFVKNNSSTTWIRGRDYALVRSTTSGATTYAPLISSKTVAGSWDIGTYGENLCISHTTDANYNANTNSVTTFTIDQYGNTTLKPNVGSWVAGHYQENTSAWSGNTLTNICWWLYNSVLKVAYVSVHWVFGAKNNDTAWNIHTPFNMSGAAIGTKYHWPKGGVGFYIIPTQFTFSGTNMAWNTSAMNVYAINLEEYGDSKANTIATNIVHCNALVAIV